MTPITSSMSAVTNPTYNNPKPKQSIRAKHDLFYIIFCFQMNRQGNDKITGGCGRSTLTTSQTAMQKLTMDFLRQTKWWYVLCSC